MIKKEALLFGLIVLFIVLSGNSIIDFVSADEVNSTGSVSITIISLIAENISNYGIFEPLCCDGGTGDWCIDNDKFNTTTLEGDIYCEGENAGDDIKVNVQHVLRFNFSDLTVASGDMLQCLVEQSNGTLINITETGLTLSNTDYILEYAISNDTDIERDVSASVHDLPWGIHNCSIINGTGTTTFPINEVVFVHRNLDWDTFDYQKAVFAENDIHKFFNNTRALKTPYVENDNKSYTRYLTFKHYSGSQTEEFCFDGSDNDEDLLIDYDDNDCRTFAHRYDSDEMNFTIPNFLVSMSLFDSIVARITGYVISSDDDNLFEGSLGNTNYQYTKNTDNDGSFKIRLYESSPGTSGFGYIIKNVPNISSVDMIGSMPSGYLSSYLCGDDANLPEGLCNIVFDCSACGNTALDFVYIVNSSDTGFDSESVFTLRAIHGTLIETDTFSVWFDPDEGLNNTNESESSAAVNGNNLCEDEVNNDLDIATTYTYLTGLSFSNQILFARDCADADCNGVLGPDYGAAETAEITYSQGECEYLTELNCLDGYDNDFNDDYTADADGLSGTHYTDCHDVDCFRNGAECPTSEAGLCNNGLNDDWDYVDTDLELSSGHKIGNTDNTISGGTSWNNSKYILGSNDSALIDCEDPDCDTSVGGSSEELCEWGQELNCTDGFNNDALQTYDCQFSGTYGLGGGGPPTYSHAEYDCASDCRTGVDNVEDGTQCNDGLDNDYDYWTNTGIFSGTENTTGGIDCGWNGTGKSYNPDPDCHLETMSNLKKCELGVELTCNDSFSNDYDGSHTTNAGWSQEAYNEYFEGIGVDMTYVDNADCDDYDCYGNPNCPDDESLNHAWCFDGADNDLDNFTDCSDSDCVGIRNPEDLTEVCFEYEFNSTLVSDADASTSSVQFCGNLLDDENKDDDNPASVAPGYPFNLNSIGQSLTGTRGNKTDCNDLDCWQKFGQCAPCSSNEFVEWDSCFDGNDNDHDDSADSSDTDCDGQIVEERGYNASNYPASETSCMNDFDDDKDGKTDCSDSDCIGELMSPDGRLCGTLESGTESTCTDDFDNDEDGDIDCYDDDCETSCGYDAIDGSGTNTYSPKNSSFSLEGDAAVSVTATEIARKGGDLYISYSYSGASAQAVTIVLGSYAAAKVIDTSVFDVNNAEFISNPNSFSMSKTYANNGYLTFTKAAISSFSFSVRIPGKDIVSNPFTIRSTAEIGTSTGIGEFNVEVVNNVSPTIDNLRIEPSAGKLSAGDSIQVVAGNFTGYAGGQAHSGLAGKCRIQISGPNGFSLDNYYNDCNAESSGIYTSGTYNVNATIYDNTGNEGNTLSDSIFLSVAPSISVDLSRSDGKRVHFASSNENYDTFDDFFNDKNGEMTVSFRTDMNNPFFADSCQLTIRNEDGTIVSTQDISATLSNSDSQVNCLVDGRLDVLDAYGDGVYRVTVNATDSAGNSIETSEIAIFNCNDLSSAGDFWTCAVADFDVDGYTEGINQPFEYSSDGITLYTVACDSCPSVDNIGKDANGDGFDNACDPVCGDGWVEGDEECDDGNTNDGDGCDRGCDIEGEVPPIHKKGPRAEEIPLEEEILEEVSFSVLPSSVTLDMYKGESKTIELVVANFIDEDINIQIDYANFENFMIIDEDSFVLKARSSVVVPIEVFVGKNVDPGVYFGNIYINGKGEIREVGISLNVKEEKALFDVVTKVLTKGVSPGSNVLAMINLTNIAQVQGLNISLYYSIVDFSNNTLASNEEQVLVEGELSLKRELLLPEDAALGNYLFYTRAAYQDKIAYSSDSFRATAGGNIALFIVTIIIVISIGGIVAILIRRFYFGGE